MDYNIDNYSVSELIDLFKNDDIIYIDDKGNEIKPVNDRTNIIKNIQKNIESIKNKNSNVENKESILKFLNNAIDKINKDINDASSFVLNYNTKVKYETELLNTNNNKYYKRDIIEKVLVIDSKFRDKYLLSKWSNTDSIANRFESTSSNFVMNLNQDINNVIQIQLGDIEFPNTWYPFSTELGNLTFKIKLSSETVWSDVTINEGVYSYAQLIHSITDAIVAIKDSYKDIKVTINLERDGETGSNNGQATINISNGFIDNNDGYDNFDIDFFYSENNTILNAQQTLGWALGFRNIEKGYYFGKNKYTSEAIIDTVVLRYFYLILDDGLTSTVSSNILPIGNTMNIIADPTSILARISVKGSLLSNVNSQGVSMYSDVRKYPSIVNLSKFRIKILNEYGKIVNLHSSDISFTVKASIIQST